MRVNRLQCFLLPKLVWMIDRLPWFARKRAINLLLGQEVFSDLMLIGGFDLCIKW